MKIVATIEARMTSTRLPGKVLLPASGRPILESLVTRLKQVESLDEIVLATTTNATDQVLVDFARAQKIRCFRGSEEDVMSRVIGAAEAAGADVVVETTGDNPVMDPLLIEQMIRMFRHNHCDYLSNAVVRSFPIGMDTQIFPLACLKKSFAMTAHPLDREHVTRHIRLHPELFSQLHFVAPPDLHWPELALTMDETGDYQLLKNLIEYFGSANRCFSLRETIRVLREVHPEWVALNREVRRKGLS